MSGGDQPFDLRQLSDFLRLPQTIDESIAQVKNFALQIFVDEAAKKQLYYHNVEHIQNVQRRSHQIFQAVCSALEQTAKINQTAIDLARIELLLDLCAVAHDMVQIFAQDIENLTARRREPGVSEAETIDRLVQYIDQLNQQLDPDSPARVTDADIEIIREAIDATVCVYEPIEQAIYQPLLYQNRSLSIVARILALADLGALGIDGIEAYNQEGSLLFLEENLDVIPLLLDDSIDQLETADSARYENIRQRLLKRCRFQVSFAKSRLARFQQEIQGFPAAAMPALTQEIFQHLTPATIAAIEASTPTDDRVSLDALLRFFAFKRYVR